MIFPCRSCASSTRAVAFSWKCRAKNCRCIKGQQRTEGSSETQNQSWSHELLQKHEILVERNMYTILQGFQLSKQCWPLITEHCFHFLTLTVAEIVFWHKTKIDCIPLLLNWLFNVLNFRIWIKVIALFSLHRGLRSGKKNQSCITKKMRKAQSFNSLQIPKLNFT